MEQLTRRGFLRGTTATGLALGTCAASMASVATADTDDAAPTPDNVYEADLVIVGSGTAGLAAAVEAGSRGISTIVVEQADDFGGNSPAIEALFAVGDKISEEFGVEYTVADVIHTELEYSNYRTSGALWTDLVTQSEENYYWLVDQGVKFSGRVEKGSGLIPVAHVFDTSSGDARDPYTVPMGEKAQSYGVQFHYNETANRLYVEDGAVRGVYANNAEGGCDLFRAKAVILASGGFAFNPELFARAGWFGKAYEFLPLALVKNVGLGFEMANALGAGDTVPWAPGINSTYVASLGDKGTPGRQVSSDPNVIWLDENGERFVNEDFAKVTNRQSITNPLRNTKDQYVFLDRGTAEAILESHDGYLERFDEVVGSNPDDLFQGDTVEEVAEKAGLDPAKVLETVNAYNEMARAGKDSSFLKDPSYMREFAQPPYYIGKMILGVCATFGGILTNRKFEVVRDDQSVIPGLYAIGTDGCMLYRDTYTICVPTSAAAHHVNSGRHSVMNAEAYIAEL